MWEKSLGNKMDDSAMAASVSASPINANSQTMNLSQQASPSPGSQIADAPSHREFTAADSPRHKQARSGRLVRTREIFPRMMDIRGCRLVPPPPFHRTPALQSCSRPGKLFKAQHRLPVQPKGGRKSVGPPETPTSGAGISPAVSVIRGFKSVQEIPLDRCGRGVDQPGNFKPSSRKATIQGPQPKDA